MKILVVIDCQNDFISGSLASEEAKKKVPNIVKKIKEFDGDYIFLTRDTHEENYLETKEGVSLPVEHCIKNTWGWEIEDSVANVFNERINDNTSVTGFIIDKPTFGSYNLVNTINPIIPAYGDFDIEIVGFVSSICVISNAILLKTAFYENCNVIVDTNCIAGLSEENNKAAIEVMKSCQINVINE